MTYTGMTIRAVDDPDRDDRLYPVLATGELDRTIEMSRADSNPVSYGARGLVVTRTVDQRSRKLLVLDDHSVDVWVTDARVILHCAKYDKGGGWWGFGGAGVVVALAANGVSKARAARRRRGTAAVGHVRYPWLAAVGGSPKTSLLDQAQLVIRVVEPTSEGGGLVAFTLSFSRSTDVLGMAADIGLRTARHHLASDQLTQPQRVAWEEFCQTISSAPTQGRVPVHVLPTHYHVQPQTATYPHVQ